jgi:hypothetical protein
VIQKVVVEKVPTTVTKKVPVTICEKVPVTVTRNVSTTQVVKVPYTVTKTVHAVEVTRTPVTIHRHALGAYVDMASLKPDAAQAAKDVEYITGGAAALRKVNVAIYDCQAPGRVFVEGLHGSKPVLHYVTKTVATTEIRKVPYRVTKIVPHEVVKQVPITVTRMVPITVTRKVSVTTCRMVTQEVVKVVPVDVGKPCPGVVTGCQPCQTACQQPGHLRLNLIKSMTDKVPNIMCKPAAPPCGPVCGEVSTPPAGCEQPCGPRVGGCFAASITCGNPCGNCTSTSWLHKLFNDPCRPKPVQDFFHRLWANHLSCTPCKPGPCTSCGASPSVSPISQPQKAPPSSPPTTLPAITNE